MNNPDLMDKVVALCKRRGFIFQSSEIYGGLSGAWDYGPFGVELKRNLKNAWWQAMVHWREDMVGLDASILMHPKTWEASGHIANFADMMVDCKNTKCGKRLRPDQLKNNKCPACGGNMKQQFIGLKHCKCGVSWLKSEGYFERTSDMVFKLERQQAGSKIKQVPVISYHNSK